MKVLTKENAPLRICLGYNSSVMIAAVEKSIVGDVIAIDKDYFTVLVPRVMVAPAESVLGPKE